MLIFLGQLWQWRRTILILTALFGLLWVPLALAAVAGCLTPLEAGGYLRLPKASEVDGYLQELAEKFPFALSLSLGRSAGGRNITALLISEDTAFLKGGASALKKPTVMLLGAQHGTEPSGAEALQILARELLSGELSHYLADLNFVLVPLANPDGRDLHRRGNARGVNLSTDLVLLSQPESRAFATALRRFTPHVFFDIHESAVLKKKSLGAQGYLTDFEAQLEIANHPNVDIRLRSFSREDFLPPLLQAIAARGLPARSYIGEITDIRQPITHGGISLRNLRNYAGQTGSLSFLLENRLDPPGDYPTPRNIGVRVSKQLLCLRAFLQQIRFHKGQILDLVQAARNDWRGECGDTSLALVSRYAPSHSRPQITLPLRERASEKGVKMTFAYHGDVVTTQWLKPPLAYAINDHPEAIAEILDRHHIHYDIVSRPRRVLARPLYLEKTQALGGSSAGPRPFVAIAAGERETKVTVDPGDLWIDLRQKDGRLVPLLLDPRSFTGIFQEPCYLRLVRAGEDFFVLPVVGNGAFSDR